MTSLLKNFREFTLICPSGITNQRIIWRITANLAGCYPINPGFYSQIIRGACLVNLLAKRLLSTTNPKTLLICNISLFTRHMITSFTSC